MDFKYWPNWQKICFEIFEQIRKITAKFPQLTALSEREIIEFRTRDRNTFEMMDKLFQKDFKNEDFDIIYHRLGECFMIYNDKRNAFYEFIRNIYLYCDAQA